MIFMQEGFFIGFQIFPALQVEVETRTPQERDVSFTWKEFTISSSYNYIRKVAHFEDTLYDLGISKNKQKYIEKVETTTSNKSKGRREDLMHEDDG